MASPLDWLTMCAENQEFVANYNRLTGHSISFSAPAREPVQVMVDRACGHVPALQNDPAQLLHFVEFCMDSFWRLTASESRKAKA